MMQCPAFISLGSDVRHLLQTSLTQSLYQNTPWHRTSISQMEVSRSQCQTSHLGPTILSSVSLFPRSSKYLVISVYILAVMGDTGNTSPQFAITAPGSNASTLPASTTSPSSAPSNTASSSTPSAASTSGALSLYTPQGSSFKALFFCMASMIMMLIVD